jgi:hypothetical protein
MGSRLLLLYIQAREKTEVYAKVLCWWYSVTVSGEVLNTEHWTSLVVSCDCLVSCCDPGAKQFSSQRDRVLRHTQFGQCSN